MDRRAIATNSLVLAGADASGNDRSQSVRCVHDSVGIQQTPDGSDVVDRDSQQGHQTKSHHSRIWQRQSDSLWACHRRQEPHQSFKYDTALNRIRILSA